MYSFISKDNFWKILIITLFLLLPVLIAIGLGRVNILKLGKTPPPSPTPAPVVTTDASKIFLYCPTTSDYCSKGRNVIQNGVYLGFGGNLKSGSPIKAAFNGKVTTATTLMKSKTGTEKITTITLQNDEAKTTAIYYYIGEGPTPGSIPTSPNGYVKVGTTLGKVTKDIRAYQTSLLFQMYKGDAPATGQKLQLDTRSFLD